MARVLALALAVVLLSPAVASAAGDPLRAQQWNLDNRELSGNSQATPHVSGLAALLVACGLHGQAAVQRMLATARDLGTPGPDLTYGYGLVDARGRRRAGLPWRERSTTARGRSPPTCTPATARTKGARSGASR